MIQNLIFGILFLKILFQAYNFFYILPHVPVDIIRVFFNFRFSSRKSQSQQKLAKKITHFIMQFSKTSLILRTSTHLALKIICSHNIDINLSDFTKFLANRFLFGVTKNICTAPLIDAHELHS